MAHTSTSDVLIAAGPTGTSAGTSTGAPTVIRAAQHVGTPSWRTRRRARRRGSPQPFDRRELERDGWRTTIEYCENLVRGRDGRLQRVDASWRAEGELVDAVGGVHVVTSVAASASAAWNRLRVEADQVRIDARRAPAATA